MKHKYSKLMIFLYYVLAFFTGFLTATIFAVIIGDLSMVVKYAFPICVIVCLSITIDNKLRTNRYVEFFDEHVHFHSLNIVHKKKEYCLNVRYEDIYEITVKKSSSIGIHLIYVKANNFGYAIPMNCFYSKYKKMYATLYQKVIKANPNARIDQRFIDFLERKNLL